MAGVCSSETSNITSTIGDHLKLRKPRNQPPRTTTDPPPPQIPSLVQSTRCKSAISSLLLSTFSNNNGNSSHEPTQKSGSKKGSKVVGSGLLGFGCTAQPEVSVPGLIRSSAGWDDTDNIRKMKKNENKNKKKKKKKSGQHLQGGGGGGVLLMDDLSSSSDVGVGVGVQDLWCAAADSSVDCVRPLSSRGKIDLDKILHRERGGYSSRQRVNPENYGGLDLDSSLGIGPDVFEARYYRHLRNRSPEGLDEILMFQNGLLMRRSGGLDRYRDWRLDVDNMTYEELLELGEKIGHVSTGLGEDQIGQCLRKTKLSVLDELSSQSHEPEEMEGKCTICQEEYEADDEMGKLECGHAYHLHCIKQWLIRKNACPVCKVEASSQ